MRQAINMVGAGQTEECFRLLDFLHQLRAGFLHAERYQVTREMRKKIQVLDQSLKKVRKSSI